MLRKHEKPLSQLHNRIAEYAGRSEKNYDNNISNTSFPVLLKPDGKKLSFECVNSHKEIQFKNFKLTTKPADNCCYLKDGTVFCIEFIGFKNKIPIIIGRKYIHLRPVSIYLCNSQHMKIHMANEFHDVEVKDVKEIIGKAFRIIFNGSHYVMSLLHL